MNNTDAGIVRFWPFSQIGDNSALQSVKLEGGYKPQGLITGDRNSKMNQTNLFQCPSNFNPLYNPLSYLSTIGIYQKRSAKPEKASIGLNIMNLHSYHQNMDQFNPLSTLCYLQPRREKSEIKILKEKINLSDDDGYAKTGPSSPKSKKICNLDTPKPNLIGLKRNRNENESILLNIPDIEDAKSIQGNLSKSESKSTLCDDYEAKCLFMSHHFPKEFDGKPPIDRKLCPIDNQILLASNSSKDKIIHTFKRVWNTCEAPNNGNNSA